MHMNACKCEWVRYIALRAQGHIPDCTAARVERWHAKWEAFPLLSSIHIFFVRRPRSACLVERAFGLTGHIQTKDGSIWATMLCAIWLCCMLNKSPQTIWRVKVINLAQYRCSCMLSAVFEFRVPGKPVTTGAGRSMPQRAAGCHNVPRHATACSTICLAWGVH